MHKIGHPATAIYPGLCCKLSNPGNPLPVRGHCCHPAMPLVCRTEGAPSSDPTPTSFMPTLLHPSRKVAAAVYLASDTASSYWNCWYESCSAPSTSTDPEPPSASSPASCPAPCCPAAPRAPAAADARSVAEVCHSRIDRTCRQAGRQAGTCVDAMGSPPLAAPTQKADKVALHDSGSD